MVKRESALIDNRHDPQYEKPEPTATERSLDEIADSVRTLLEIEVSQRNLDGRVENLYWLVEKMSHDIKMIEHNTRAGWWVKYAVGVAAIVYLYRSFT
jgi:hypothetical protein